MQVPRKKKDIKILHLENIYVIIVYKEIGEIMGLFSSKPKKSERVEWHPTGPNNKIRRFDFDEENNTLKNGVIWSANWDFNNYENILFCIDEMRRNHKELMYKMDQIINDNKELKERCEALEKENLIKKR